MGMFGRELGLACATWSCVGESGAEVGPTTDPMWQRGPICKMCKLLQSPPPEGASTPNFHASVPSVRADFNGDRGKPKDIRLFCFLMPPIVVKWLLAGFAALDGVLTI